MLAPKLRVASPVPVREQGRGHVVHEQGNPNMTGSGFDFPSDPDFGLSRQDVYPSRHAGSWVVRLLSRFVW